MAKLSVLICLALTTAASVNGAPPDTSMYPIELDLDYWERPRGKELNHLDLVSGALESLVIQYDSDPSTILSHLRRASKDSSFETDEQEIYAILAEAANDNGRCTESEIEHVFGLMLLIEEFPERDLDIFTDYLHNQVGNKFKRCANDIADTLNLSPDVSGVIKAFDKFYATNELDLDRLRMFDPTTSEFNAQRMLAVAKDYAPTDSEDNPDTIFSPVIDFLRSACEKLELHLGDTFKTVNLAINLGHQPNLEAVGLDKLNEYHRLCLFIKHESVLRKFATNFYSQLKK